MTFPCSDSAFRCRGAGPRRTTIRRVARRAEELGYASLWTFQRVLAPAGAALGPAHESVLDPVVPLAYVAGHTDRIRLGTATDLRAVHGSRAAREDA